MATRCVRTSPLLVPILFHPSLLRTSRLSIAPATLLDADPVPSRAQRVHRTALLWLKEWDLCVFKGTSKTNGAAELKRDRRNKRAREGEKGGFGGGGAGAGGEGFEEAVRRLARARTLPISS